MRGKFSRKFIFIGIVLALSAFFCWNPKFPSTQKYTKEEQKEIKARIKARIRENPYLVEEGESKEEAGERLFEKSKRRHVQLVGGIDFGIDLDGGAELRYRFNLREIDRDIRVLEALKDKLALQNPTEQRVDKLIRDSLEGDDPKKGYEPILESGTPEEQKAKLKELRKELDQLQENSSLKKAEDVQEAIQSKREQKRQDTGQTVDTIRRRIDPAGTRNARVTKFAENRILVEIPFKKITEEEEKGLSDQAAKDVDKNPRFVTEAGSKKAAIAKRFAELHRLHFEQKVAEISELVTQQGVLGFYMVVKTDSAGLVDAMTNLKDRKLPPDGYIFAIPAGTPADENDDLLNSTWPEEGRTYPTWNNITRNGEDTKMVERYFRLAKPKEKKDALGPMLLRMGDGTYQRHSALDGRQVANARTGQGNEGWEVYMTFKPRGASVFYALTRANVGKSFAIVLDREVHSAPNIKEAIPGGTARISGSFTKTGVERLAQVLKAGSLAIKVEHESEIIIGPELGKDSIRKGITSIGIAFTLVLLFMAVYYLWCGGVADLALMMNLVLLLGALAFINGTLTLPGMAGILLTVGMAVDANVLIFERVREELARGRNLRMAIQVGYDRAFSAIVDANVTTLLTALVLYNVGTGPIRGFALTLIIGISASLFTALYCTRVLIEFLVTKRWLKELRMRRMIGETKIGFLKRAPIFGVVSLLAVAGSLAFFFSFGNDIYGIDFLGGTRFVVKFQKVEQDTDAAAGVSGPQATAFAERVRARVNEELRDNGEPFAVTAVTATAKNSDQDVVANTQYALTIAELGEAEQDKTAAETFRKHVERVIHDNLRAKIVPPANGTAGALTVVVDFEKLKVTREAVTAKDARTFVRQVRGRVVADLKIKDKELDPFHEKVQAIDPLGDGSSYTYTIRTTLAKDKEKDRKALAALREQLRMPREGGTTVEGKLYERQVSIEGNESIGSAVAGDMKNSAIMSIVLSLIVIFAYILLRFDFSSAYGLGAVVALFHDVLIALGAICVANLVGSNIKIDLNVVAAMLTIVGYSLNDTIVIYDRIRENRRSMRGRPLREIVNVSLNQTLARTLLTSTTTLIAVACLLVFGGDVIRDLSFTLFVGVLVGTYSSIFVASPIMVRWTEYQQHRAERAKPA